MFDAGRVRDLPWPGGARRGERWYKSSGNSQCCCQLGEILPVVPARIVRRVLRGDYVDMAELTEENLELELWRAADGDEAKSAVPLSRLKVVPDVLTWARSFCLGGFPKVRRRGAAPRYSIKKNFFNFFFL